MSIADECLERAEICREKGVTASCAENRASFLVLELQWRRMATRAALRDRYWAMFAKMASS
ncbi:MAG: hypothetical protein ABIO39_15505 [Caulobacteraceae bacterium]